MFLDVDSKYVISVKNNYKNEYTHIKNKATKKVKMFGLNYIIYYNIFY